MSTTNAATDGSGARPAVPTGNTYDKYGSGNPVERRLMARFLSDLDALLPRDPPRRVLEVGVGEGEIAARLRRRWPDSVVAGIDLPDEELAASWRSKDLAASIADIAALPFASDSFDLVLAIEVLEHVDDPPAALSELERVATAHVVASVPREPIWRAANMARGKYWRDLGNTPGHVNHWSRAGFVDLLSTTFRIEATRTPFPWTMVGASVRRR